jgi:hypothetical protein
MRATAGILNPRCSLQKGILKNLNNFENAKKKVEILLETKSEAHEE